ncbi:HalOD1 output domain-containing protein [Halopenitus sp. H-Gu1]|uniref:HalOD1 output domain-containing protein n=1 Tax=Halopenitus sp. H-Gu1 TaxID=3242697 RepID=UPI00359E94C6
MTRRYEVTPEIVEAIAEVDGISPHDLEYTLYEYIDTEALEKLMTSEHRDWELMFQVPNHTVMVRGNGQILIDGAIVRDLSDRQFERVE